MTRMWNTFKSWVTTHALLLFFSRDVLQADMVEFNGKFDDNSQEMLIPVSLQSSINTVMRGSASSTNINRGSRQVTIGHLMAFSTAICIQNQSSSVYHSRKREPPVAVYVAQMIRSKKNVSFSFLLVWVTL